MIAARIGIPKYRTNQADVDEQLIKEVTGHRSDAVRNYKRKTEMMK